MNTASFIAKRIRLKEKGSFASIAQFLAITSIAVGVASLIIAYSILEGFKTKVREKIFNFDSHIEVSQFDINSSPFDKDPISTESDVYNKGLENPNIKSVNPFIYTSGILHANNHVYGSILKGVNNDFIKNNVGLILKRGRLPEYSDTSRSKEIVISEYLANKLELDTASKLNFYFFDNDKLKPRKLIVSGVYETHLEEFDRRITIADIRLLQQLNAWPDTMVGGYEIQITNPEFIDQVDDQIFEMLDIHMQSQKITDKYGYLFDWLSLLDQNVGLFIIILMIIAFFNISSVMYIILLERTNMIGVLKAIGASNSFIQKMFWLTGIRILKRGLLIGNIAALAFCLSQYYFEWIPLDPVNYYMSSVPIEWVWLKFVLVNILTVCFVLATLYLPLQVTKRISIIKSIRFD